MALRYGPIEFVYPQTETHVMGPERDPSGTDQLFTVIKLKVRSIISLGNLDSPTQIRPARVSDGNAGATIARIRHMLCQPRQPLYYDLVSPPGGRSTKPTIDLPSGLDDANGPWPDEDAFSAHYTTPTTIEVSWACTIKIRDCGGNVPVGPLSLRWEDTISWDRTFKSTYRRVGTLILSSLSPNGVDYYRKTQLAPVVAPGFARTTASYTISRDGLRCDFVFVDEQIRFAPPPPAIDLNIVQSESFKMLGGMRAGNVEVSLVGKIDANVVDLYKICVQIARARIWAATPLKSGTAVIGDAVFSTKEGRSDVSCTFVASYKIPAVATRETKSNSTGSWIGRAVITSPANALASALMGGDTPKTEQGKSLGGAPLMSWVGAGTSPVSPTNSLGYAKWAVPNAQVNAPAVGVGLASALKLAAAVMGDPCGIEVELAGDRDSITELVANVNIGGGNSPGAGNGNTKNPVNRAMLTAAFSQFNASQYPTTDSTLLNDGLSVWDGLPAVYDHWECLTEYEDDRGSLVVPTCNPSGTNLKINHSSNTLRIIRRWSAKRTGAPPAVPPMESNNPNVVFIRAYSAPREVRAAADDVSVIYEEKGVYVYEALNPALVDKSSLVPPFLSEEATFALTRWSDGPPTVADLTLLKVAARLGNSVLASAGFGPLGSGTLPFGPRS